MGNKQIKEYIKTKQWIAYDPRQLCNFIRNFPDIQHKSNILNIVPKVANYGFEGNWAEETFFGGWDACSNHLETHLQFHYHCGLYCVLGKKDSDLLFNCYLEVPIEDLRSYCSTELSYIPIAINFEFLQGELYKAIVLTKLKETELQRINKYFEKCPYFDSSLRIVILREFAYKIGFKPSGASTRCKSISYQNIYERPRCF